MRGGRWRDDTAVGGGNERGQMTPDTATGEKGAGGGVLSEDLRLPQVP